MWVGADAAGPHASAWLGGTTRRRTRAFPGDAARPTIVEYTDREPARKEYPVRIVSPPRPGACCEVHMVGVGDVREIARWIVQYRRCTRCGFTVLRILREVPDRDALHLLRRRLASAFTRKRGERA